MDVFDAINGRRSVRRFDAARGVDASTVDALVLAASQSPSWANMQCWRFIAVRDAAARARISEIASDEAVLSEMGYKANPSRKALAEAPVVLVACADPAGSGITRGQEYYLVDMGIAAQTLMLAAHAMGLGTVYVGIYDEDALRDLLGIPAHMRVTGLFPVGYPADHKPCGTSRKPVSEVLFHDRWPA